MTDLTISASANVLRNNYLGHLAYLWQGKSYLIPITYYFEKNIKKSSSSTNFQVNYTPGAFLLFTVLKYWKLWENAGKRKGNFANQMDLFVFKNPNRSKFQSKNLNCQLKNN